MTKSRNLTRMVCSRSRWSFRYLTNPSNEKAASTSSAPSSLSAILITSFCMNGAFSITRKEQRRDQKAQYRGDQSVHKYIVGKSQPPVFLAQGNPLEINVPYQAPVKEILIVQHDQHPAGIVLEAHPVKIAKEKQVHLFLFQVGLTKPARGNMRPRSQN